MAIVTGIEKTITWVIRIFQLLFAVILVGTLSYMIHQYKEIHAHKPRELIVPEVFSVLALFVTFFSIAAICFLGHMLQLVAAALDFVIFVGYLASAILLRHNYHARAEKNPLRNALISIRIIRGENPHDHLQSGLVRLLVALVIIELFLFFITTLLSTFVARRTRDTRVYHEKPLRGGAVV